VVLVKALGDRACKQQQRVEIDAPLSCNHNLATSRNFRPITDVATEPYSIHYSRYETLSECFSSAGCNEFKNDNVCQKQHTNRTKSIFGAEKLYVRDATLRTSVHCRSVQA